MIIKLALHGLDIVKGLFAKLFCQVRVHVTCVDNQRGSLKESGPNFARHAQNPVTSDDNDIRFHNITPFIH